MLKSLKEPNESSLVSIVCNRLTHWTFPEWPKSLEDCLKLVITEHQKLLADLTTFNAVWSGALQVKKLSPSYSLVIYSMSSLIAGPVQWIGRCKHFTNDKNIIWIIFDRKTNEIIMTHGLNVAYLSAHFGLNVKISANHSSLTRLLNLCSALGNPFAEVQMRVVNGVSKPIICVPGDVSA